jgi:uncharacterized protein (TIGR02421 family)
MSAWQRSEQASHLATVQNMGSRRQYDDLISTVGQKIARGERIRRSLPEYGRLHIDRPLPFLALYRQPENASDPGTEQLVTTEASYLCASGSRDVRSNLRRLILSVCEPAAERFGGVFLLEISSRPPSHPPVVQATEPGAAPGFRIFCTPSSESLTDLLEVLTRELGRIKLLGRKAEVELVTQPRDFPDRVKPLFTEPQAAEHHLVQLGLEVEPMYQTEKRDSVYPEALRLLRARLGRVLKYGFFQFAQQYTSHRAESYHSLGRRAVVQAVWKVDRALDDISRRFDFLLEVNPINAEAAWSGFRRTKFEKVSPLRYRPLSIDPSLAKRKLFAIPVEHIEDPTIALLFRDKQAELDRQLTMLADRGTERFLLGSRQLYGSVDSGLLRTAEELLERVPATPTSESQGGSVRADQFLKRAEEELSYYRGLWDGFEGTARISDQVAAGLMVSRGELLIAANTRTHAARVDALLQHEIGTHLVTYFNGNAQRLTQMRTGFAGYDELQEGLAVLAEYLAGGMSPSRLRTLAGRVVGAKMLIDGASFVDTFRLLSRYGFARRPAFNITIRLYRGGGLTKDVVYLRGLLAALAYFEEGRPLEPLFVGKIAAHHIPLIQELERRRIISPPQIMPRYLTRQDCQRRLDRVRAGLRVFELLDD